MWTVLHSAWIVMLLVGVVYVDCKHLMLYQLIIRQSCVMLIVLKFQMSLNRDLCVAISQ